MATANSSVPVSPHLGDGQALQSGSAAQSREAVHSRPVSFVKFEEKQATVFVNMQHIVRYEYHTSTGRAHLQLSDGHHYYLCDDNALDVIEQLNGQHASAVESEGAK